VISRCRRKAQTFGRLEIQTRELFEKSPAFAQRLLQVGSFILSEEVKGDVHSWMGFGQFLNATHGRM
jgi:hypothetical protein